MIKLRFLRDLGFGGALFWVTAFCVLAAATPATAYTLRYEVSHPDGARIDGKTVQTVAAGGSGTAVAAYPYFDHRFVQWSDGRTDNPRTDVNVNADLTVTAVFEPFNPYTDENVLEFVNFTEDFDYWNLSARNVSLGMVQKASGEWALGVRATAGYGSYVQFRYPTRDVSTHRGLAVKITNTGTNKIVLEAVSVNDVNIRAQVEVWPGETEILYGLIQRGSVKNIPTYYIERFGTQHWNGLNGFYLGGEPDLTDIGEEALRVSVVRVMDEHLNEAPGQDCEFTVDYVRLAGTYKPITQEDLDTTYAPFYDEWGQPAWKEYKHKVHSWDQFMELHAEDAAERAAQPAQPMSYNQYGGWNNPPQWLVEDIATTGGATGRFRLHRDRNGRWWFIDPTGAPFLGIGAVGAPGWKFDTSLSAEPGPRLPLHAYNPGRGYSANNTIRLFTGTTTPTPDYRENMIQWCLDRYRSWGFTVLTDKDDLLKWAPTHRRPYVYHGRSGSVGGVKADIDYTEQSAKIAEELDNDPEFQFAKNDPYCIGAWFGNETHMETGEAADIYTRVFKEQLKLRDPDMLFLGTRSKPFAPERAQNVDALSFTSFGGYGPPLGNSVMRTDKPAFLTAYRLSDFEGYSTGGYFMTHKQRGRGFVQFYKELFESPNGIGASFFTYSGVGWNLRVNHDSGVMDPQTRLPYYEIVNAFRFIGENMFHWRATVETPPANIKPSFERNPHYRLLPPGQTLNLELEATDLDGDTLSFALVSGPAWVSLVNGRLQGTPGGTDYGMHPVRVTVSDGVNPPVPGEVFVEVADAATLTYLASPGGSVDGETVQFIRQGLSGAAVVARADAGYHFEGWSDGATEARRKDEDVVLDGTFTALFAQATPAFESTNFTMIPAVVGLPYQRNLAGRAADLDGDALSFSKVSGPAWLNVAADGSLSGAPTAADAGWNVWTVQVADGFGGSDTATLRIEVAAPLWSEDFTAGVTLRENGAVEYVSTEPAPEDFTIADAGWQFVNEAGQFVLGKEKNKTWSAVHVVDESVLAPHGAGWYRLHYEFVDANDEVDKPWQVGRLGVRVFDAHAGGTADDNYWFVMKNGVEGVLPSAVGATGDGGITELAGAEHTRGQHPFGQ